MHKPRIQSPLDSLPLHVKQALRAWLTTGGPHGQGITYAQAKRRLEAEFNVKASAAALSGFFHRSTSRADLVATASEASTCDGRVVTVVIKIPE